MEVHITDFFQELLKEYGSIDIAAAELKRPGPGDAGLQAAYREWCHEVGSSEKNGFLDYCEEFLESQDSIWENLKDEYDDE